MGASTASPSTGDGNVMEQVYGGGTTVPKKKKTKTPKEIAETVKNQLGLGTSQPGGSETQIKQYGAYNLKGKDIYMYGEEASQLTNEEMVKAGLAERGNYFKQVGGKFIRIGKKEGEKLMAQGDSSVSVSYKMTSSGKEIKHGISGGAMGSGDPTGALTSIPISSQMLQRQNEIKTAIQGVIGLMTPAPLSTVAKLGMARSSADLLQPGAAYKDYTQQFKAKQAGKKFTSTRNIMGVLGLTGHKKKTLGGEY
jgi:hypothetical protein